MNLDLEKLLELLESVFSKIDIRLSAETATLGSHF